MKNIRRFCLIIALIFIITQLGLITNSKAENSITTVNKDVVMLIDSSKSMITSDPQNIRLQAINVFLQLCSMGDKVGLAAYSDQILKEVELKTINSQEDIDSFMNSINGIELGQWTDIGLALSRGVSMLDNGRDSIHSPIIILLSDGKNDPSRDKGQSENDIKNSLKAAKDKGYKVYTIGLNGDGTLDENLLKDIAAQTNGKYYPAKSASELENITQEIYADAIGTKPIPGNQPINGKNQNITINIPDKNVLEANVVMKSGQGVQILDVTDASGQSQINRKDMVRLSGKSGDNNSVLKLLNPSPGNWTVTFIGKDGDELDYNLIYSYDLALDLSLSPEKASKGDKIKAEASLSINNQKYLNKDFYNTLKGKFQVKDSVSGKTTEYELANGENSFNGEFVLESSDPLEVKAFVSGTNFNKESPVVRYGAQNQAPVVANKIKNQELAKGKKIIYIDLKNAFSDPDGDPLTYKIVSKDGNIVGVNESSGKIALQPVGKGKTSITVTARDNKGGSVSQEFNVEVTSQISIVMIVLFILLGILIIAIIAFLVRKFIIALKLFGNISYQLKDDSNNTTYSREIKQLPPVRKITLYQLLMLGPEFQELDKILITPGNHGTSIIITNKSACLIEQEGISSSMPMIEVNNGGNVTIINEHIQKSIIINYYY